MLAHRPRAGSLVRLALGAALLSSAALLARSAEAQPTLICSASDSDSPTGRQYARVAQSPRDTRICVREKLGGIAPPEVPDCWRAVADSGFECTEIVDFN